MISGKNAARESTARVNEAKRVTELQKSIKLLFHNY